MHGHGLTTKTLAIAPNVGQVGRYCGRLRNQYSERLSILKTQYPSTWQLSIFTRTGHNSKVVGGLFKNPQPGGASIFVYCIGEIALSESVRKFTDLNSQNPLISMTSNKEYEGPHPYHCLHVAALALSPDCNNCQF